MLYSNNVKYLTPQNLFLEGVKFWKFEILLPAGNNGICNFSIAGKKALSYNSLYLTMVDAKHFAAVFTSWEGIISKLTAFLCQVHAKV